MQNQTRPGRGFWSLYSIEERGEVAAYLLIATLFVQLFFKHPDFQFHLEGSPDIFAFQLAFTVSRFTEILHSWQSIAIFKNSLRQVDFLFPPLYAGLLAFAYASIRGNRKPGRFDRFLFAAPFLAAALDFGENGLHLYLLRGIHQAEDLQRAMFSPALVFAASLFALLKWALVVLSLAAMAALVLYRLMRLFGPLFPLRRERPYLHLVGWFLLAAGARIGLNFFPVSDTPALRWIPGAALILIAGALLSILLKRIVEPLEAMVRQWLEWSRLRMPYLYLLRFPLLANGGMIALAFLSFFTGARSLLENLFDVRGWGIFWISMTAFLLAWTAMATRRLILLYGPRRFHVQKLPVPDTFGWKYFLPQGMPALPLILGAIIKSGGELRGNVAEGILFAALGLAATLGLLFAATFLQRLFSPMPIRRMENEPAAAGDSGLPIDLLFPSGGASPSETQQFRQQHPPLLGIRTLLQKQFQKLGPGFVDPRGSILSGHLMASNLLGASLLIYAAIGILQFPDWLTVAPIPALTYLLWLLILGCWGLTALSFIFDRFRLPVLVPIGLLLILSAQTPVSDHYYQIIDPQQSGAAPSDSREQPLSSANLTGMEQAPERMIVVAASGGGIQAAAWTAQVLTGLNEASNQEFGRKLHLISAVSGGSVGTMYFVNAYDSQGRLHHEKVLAQSQQSSIDAIGWGLVYPDFLRTLCPYCIDASFIDRGAALEMAWLGAVEKNGGEEARNRLRHASLSQWRADGIAGRKPFIIFNTTIADSGERLLLDTLPLRDRSNSGNHDDFAAARPRGSHRFSEIYTGKDLAVVTAARLSATFPFVTPAARANLPGAQYHIVDGGYYDNYGVSSIAEWLNESARSGKQKRRILIVQIRAFPIEDTARKPNQSALRGWFYQAFAPISTLLNVRTAGQYAHKDVEMKLLNEVLENRGIDVEFADFEFQSPTMEPAGGESSMGVAPPLSWHLTRRQMEEIRLEWKRPRYDGMREKVTNFLFPPAT